MKNSLKKTFILSALVVAGVTTATTFAYQAQSARPNIDETTKTAIETAMSTKDYTAFQEATKDLQKMNALTEEKFNEMLEHRQEREERVQNMEDIREQVQAAIKANDYNARQKVAHEDILKSIDTEAKFSKLVTMHELMDAAQKIREELGLPERKIGQKDGINPEMMKNRVNPNNENKRSFMPNRG